GAASVSSAAPSGAGAFFPPSAAERHGGAAHRDDRATDRPAARGNAADRPFSFSLPRQAIKWARVAGPDPASLPLLAYPSPPPRPLFLPVSDYARPGARGRGAQGGLGVADSAKIQPPPLNSGELSYEPQVDAC